MELMTIKAPSLKRPIPALAGIGLKPQHYQEILNLSPNLGWLEVHSENYMCAGGPALRWLDRLREHYPISLHGVGLSLGTAAPLDTLHLSRLASLNKRVDAKFVSEHLSWSTDSGHYLNDLIPLPYTEESLNLFCGHVLELQDTLKRPVLIENPSSYLSYTHSIIPEHEFLISIAQKTGCQILLDVNNVFVSAVNHGFDPRFYLNQIPAKHISEIHLAGHSEITINDHSILIDDHGSQVSPEVWALYEELIARVGSIPTLIEWDSQIPDLSVLLEEANKAETILQNAQRDLEIRYANGQ